MSWPVPRLTPVQTVQARPSGCQVRVTSYCTVSKRWKNRNNTYSVTNDRSPGLSQIYRFTNYGHKGLMIKFSLAGHAEFFSQK